MKIKALGKVFVEFPPEKILKYLFSAEQINKFGKDPLVHLEENSDKKEILMQIRNATANIKETIKTLNNFADSIQSHVKVVNKVEKEKFAENLQQKLENLLYEWRIYFWNEENK
jgi:DNA-binding ferritin-like protein